MPYTDSKTFIVDRIHEHTTHVEDFDTQRIYSIPTRWLPVTAKAGDALIVMLNIRTGITEIRVDPNFTRERHESMTNLRASISKAPTGDIDL